MDDDNTRTEVACRGGDSEKGLEGTFQGETGMFYNLNWSDVYTGR